MIVLRVLVTALALLTAIVLQTSAFPMLDLPGESPAVVLVVVASVALCRGRETGMITGFAGGMLVDVAPPSDHPIGRIALVYCIVGYVLGAIRGEGRRSAFLPMLLVGFGALLAGLLDLTLGTLFGYVQATMSDVSSGLPLSVLYDVVLTPFVFPLVAALDKRLVGYRAAPL